ncbi:hypothetical protein [Streptomyces sp. NPDC003660]
MTTDLKSGCAYRATFRNGAELQQLRIGGTVPAMLQKPWLKSPVSAARDADGLQPCTWPFKSFGTGVKRKRLHRGVSGLLLVLVAPMMAHDEEERRGQRHDPYRDLKVAEL